MYEKSIIYWTPKRIRFIRIVVFVLAIDSENAGICECKYTEVPFDEKELKDLQDSALCIKQPNKFFMIFSKNGITSGVRKQIENDSNYSIITLEDLF